MSATEDPGMRGMNQHIETIREAVEYCRKDAVYHRAIEALTALETELATLRANALDLSELPEYYVLRALHFQPDRQWRAEMDSVRWHFEPDVVAIGPNPVAAFKAACARAKEANDER